jgi:hypothetical protein
MNCDTETDETGHLISAAKFGGTSGFADGLANVVIQGITPETKEFGYIDKTTAARPS